MLLKLKFLARQFVRLSGKKIGEICTLTARKNMDRVSQGRVYIIHGKPHVASKVGDAPNNLTGRLRKSIGFEVKADEIILGSGSSKINYAKYLERIMNRPNLISIIKQKEQAILRELEKFLVKSIVKE